MCTVLGSIWGNGVMGGGRFKKMRGVGGGGGESMKIIFGLSKQKRSSPTLPRVCTAQTHKGENYAFSAFLCFCSIHTLARLLGVCKFIYSVLFLQGAVLSAVSKINPASFVSFPPFCPHQNILKVARKQGASPHPKKAKCQRWRLSLRGGRKK